MSGRDTAGVIAPPPLIALAVLLIGPAFDRLSPIGVTGAVFPYSVRVVIGGALIVAAAWAVARALWRFRLAGTKPEPWKPTTALVARGIYNGPATRCIKASACSCSASPSHSRRTGFF